MRKRKKPLQKSLIPYIDAVWNYVVGCGKGCPWCYARELHEKRRAAFEAGTWPKAPAQYHKPFEEIQIMEDRLLSPFSGQKPQRILVCSVGDPFEASQRDIDRMMAVTYLTQGKNTFLWLTKHPDRMREYFNDFLKVQRWREAVFSLQGKVPGAHGVIDVTWWPNFSRNNWIGTTVTGPQDLHRVFDLVETDAYLRFLSLEPMEEFVDLSGFRSIEWIILGGGTGKALPLAVRDARRILSLCRDLHIPLYFKGWGDRVPQGQAKGMIDGQEYRESPK